MNSIERINKMFNVNYTFPFEFLYCIPIIIFILVFTILENGPTYFLTFVSFNFLIKPIFKSNFLFFNFRTEIENKETI